MLAAARELRNHLRRVAQEPDRQRATFGCSRTHTRERVVDRLARFVQIPRLQAPLDPRRVDLDAQDGRPRHRPGQRLRAAHPAEPRGQDRPSVQVGRAEVLLPRRGEGLIRPLQNPLRADVDPATGRHLAEHGQSERLEPAKLVPGRPARNEQRICDQHPRRAGMRPQHAHGLAALDEHRLVLAQLEQRPHQRAQRVVVARRFTRAAVDDQLLGAFRDLRVEVVEQHPQRSLRRPGARVQLDPARRADAREVAAERLDRRVDRTSDRHRDPSCSRSASLLRKRYHENAVASTKNPTAKMTARHIPPPVQYVTPRRIAASTP